MIGKIIILLIIVASVFYFATPHQATVVKPVNQEGYYTWNGVHELLCYSSGVCVIIGGGGHGAIV